MLVARSLSEWQPAKESRREPAIGNETTDQELRTEINLILDSHNSVRCDRSADPVKSQRDRRSGLLEGVWGTQPSSNGSLGVDPQLLSWLF